jgi:hypothetical protein
MTDHNDLIDAGWSVYTRFARWTVYSRRASETYHAYFNPGGLEFLTLFNKNGRTAPGFINDYPRRKK